MKQFSKKIPMLTILAMLMVSSTMFCGGFADLGEHNNPMPAVEESAEEKRTAYNRPWREQLKEKWNNLNTLWHKTVKEITKRTNQMTTPQRPPTPSELTAAYNTFGLPGIPDDKQTLPAAIDQTNSEYIRLKQETETDSDKKELTQQYKWVMNDLEHKEEPVFLKRWFNKFKRRWFSKNDAADNVPLPYYEQANPPKDLTPKRRNARGVTPPPSSDDIEMATIPTNGQIDKA